MILFSPLNMSKNGCSNVGIHHVGLCVKDPLVSAEFYRDILGMQIVGGTPDGTPGIGASAFLTSRPGEESHEIALFSHPQLRHVAFKVASLAELKRLYRLVLARELPIKFTFDHGASLAFYFDDPDGNTIEIYWPTGKNVRQPCLMPLDLTQTDEAILASIATETVLPTEIPF
jgi:catechol-2,3-dioxygenase